MSMISGGVKRERSRGQQVTHRPRRMSGTWKERTACFCLTTNNTGLLVLSDSNSTDTRTPSV